MIYLVHFGLGFILSLIGTIPMGMINMTIAEHSIEKSFKAAVIMASGAAFLEFWQGFVSVYFSALFTSITIINTILNWAIIPVFLALGIYFFLNKIEIDKKQGKKVGGTDFMRGMGVTALNLLAYPYWVFQSTYWTGAGVMTKNIWMVSLFSFGVAAGGFVVFVGYAWGARSLANKFEKVSEIGNKIFGSLFLLLGVLQFFRLIVWE